VVEPEMIRTQMGTHNRSENGRSVWDDLYDTTRDSNQYGLVAGCCEHCNELLSFIKGRKFLVYN
jgi:hypothetical protein